MTASKKLSRFAIFGLFFAGPPISHAQGSVPSARPSSVPSSMPSRSPSSTPSNRPSAHPSTMPSRFPSSTPSNRPSALPSKMPSRIPSSTPSNRPSAHPSTMPSASPSVAPSTSAAPSNVPSAAPSQAPTANPSAKPSAIPSLAPSSEPSRTPSHRPSGVSVSIDEMAMLPFQLDFRENRYASTPTPPPRQQAKETPDPKVTPFLTGMYYLHADHSPSVAPSGMLTSATIAQTKEPSGPPAELNQVSPLYFFLSTLGSTTFVEPDEKPRSPSAAPVSAPAPSRTNDDSPVSQDEFQLSVSFFLRDIPELFDPSLTSVVETTIARYLSEEIAEVESVPIIFLRTQVRRKTPESSIYGTTRIEIKTTVMVTGDAISMDTLQEGVQNALEKDQEELENQLRAALHSWSAQTAEATQEDFVASPILGSQSVIMVATCVSTLLSIVVAFSVCAFTGARRGTQREATTVMKLNSAEDSFFGDSV